MLLEGAKGLFEIFNSEVSSEAEDLDMSFQIANINTHTRLEIKSHPNDKQKDPRAGAWLVGIRTPVISAAKGDVHDLQSTTKQPPSGAYRQIILQRPVPFGSFTPS